METKRRSSVNVIIPARLFQRAQIYTWSREAKQRCFEEISLTAIVNFWPKLDPEWGDAGLDWIMQISTPRSEGMLLRHVQQAAESVADYLLIKDKSVLVLCEAGKTRSVFFCVLVVSILNNSNYADALAYVKGRIPSMILKGFMIDWMRQQDCS